MHISQWNMWSLIHSEAFFIRYIFEQLVFLKPRHELIGLYSWIWSKISRCNFFSRILILDHFRRKKCDFIFIFILAHSMLRFFAKRDTIFVWRRSNFLEYLCGHIQVRYILFKFRASKVVDAMKFLCFLFYILGHLQLICLKYYLFLNV